MPLGLSLILASVGWGSWRSLLRLGCLDLVGGGRESPFFRVEGCFLVLVLAGSSCLGGMTSASLVGCLSRGFLWVSVSGGRESLRPARTNRLPGLGASCRSFPTLPVEDGEHIPGYIHNYCGMIHLLISPLRPVCTQTHMHTYTVSLGVGGEPQVQWRSKMLSQLALVLLTPFARAL